MRAIGVDHGDRFVGLAVSDGTGLAVARATIDVRIERPVDVILRTAKEIDAEVIVIGLPLEMSGRVGLRAKSAERFANEIRGRTKIRIELIDERLTSAGAHRELREAGVSKQKKHVDAVAATMILQVFLDARERTKPRDPR